jgi:hypothetical protein
MLTDMTCPFRDDLNKKCLIYEIRPEICRVFQCNQKRDIVVANKMRMHGVNNVVLMRNEFFGNTEDLELVLASFGLLSMSKSEDKANDGK